MTTTVLTHATDEALEALLPIERVRKLCFVNNTRLDEELKDYRRAALDEGQDEARASFLPQTLLATFRVPYAASAMFGMEGKVVDLDGVVSVVRLHRGPIISVSAVHFLDEGGEQMEVVDQTSFAVESGKFVRWSEGFRFPNRPSFAIQYLAGYPTNHPKLAAIRVAVGELIAAKWDAKGGSYVMPTSARRVFHAMRGSRTYLPGA